MFAKYTSARACVLFAAGVALIGSAMLALTPATAQAQPPEPIPHAHNAALLQPFRDPLAATPDPLPASPTDAAGLDAAAAELAPSFGSFSTLAYQSYRDGNWEIYVADGDGGKPVNVTRHRAADANPDLVFGATRIVFNSNRDGNSEIYSMNVDGSDLRRLTYSSAADYAPAWSPDGKRIAFVSDRNKNLDLWVMDADGGNLARVTTGPQPDVGPTWGSNVTLYWSQLHGQYNELGDILKVDVRTPNNATAIRSNLLLLGAVAMSRDGSVMVADYDIDKDYWTELVQIGSAPSADRQFYSGGVPYVDYHAEAISGDRKWALGTRYEYTVVNHKLVLKAIYLERVSIAGGVSTQRLAGTGLDASPAWASTDIIAPKVSLQSPPAYSSQGPIKLEWRGGDYGPAGIASYEIQWAHISGATAVPQWHIFLAEASSKYTKLSIIAPDGPGTYLYRIRGRDAAGNVPDWPDDWFFQAQTMVYVGSHRGAVTDNRGVHLPAVNLEGADGAYNAPVAGLDGNYVLYFGSYPPHAIRASAPGYGLFPPTLFDAYSPYPHNFYLPPRDNVLANSGFEDNLDGWTGGVQVSGLLKNGAHSGHGGMALQASCTELCSPEASVAQTQITVSSALQAPTLAFFYANDRLYDQSGLSFVVQVADAVTTTQAYSGSISVNWTQGWVDLSQWQGQTVTVTFQVLPAENPLPVRVYVDDVTVGSWTTPVIDSVTPSAFADSWGGAAISVHGANFASVVHAYLGQAEVPVQVMDPTTLVVTLPGDLAFGVYDLVVENASGQRQVVADALRLGSGVNLPALFNAERP